MMLENINKTLFRLIIVKCIQFKQRSNIEKSTEI